MANLAWSAQGLIRAGPVVEENNLAVGLWVHETLRVFYDRLINDEDRTWLTGLLSSTVLSFCITWLPLLYMRCCRMSPRSSNIKAHLHEDSHLPVHSCIQPFRPCIVCIQVVHSL